MSTEPNVLNVYPFVSCHLVHPLQPLSPSLILSSQRDRHSTESRMMICWRVALGSRQVSADVNAICPLHLPSFLRQLDCAHLKCVCTLSSVSMCMCVCVFARGIIHLCAFISGSVCFSIWSQLCPVCWKACLFTLLKSPPGFFIEEHPFSGVIGSNGPQRRA